MILHTTHRRAALAAATLLITLILPAYTVAAHQTLRSAGGPTPPVQAPALLGAPPISAHDRVYSADQTSNTVSVINPATNQVLGTIPLGHPRGADDLSPIYYDQVDTHGLGFSPDGRTLAVVNVTTNGIVLIDTATNHVKGVVYVGRAPHEAFFTPDGRELWVAVRGENYISVIDPAALREVRRVPVMLGPSMVIFRPDGRYAFVPSSRLPELDVIDTATYGVVARVPMASSFMPNLAVSADGREVWVAHKDIGAVTVLDARTFKVRQVIMTGTMTNHVNLASNHNGDFAYVTVGGLDMVKVFRRGPAAHLVATIPTGYTPHGVWPSPDGTRLYVALQDQNAVAVIDTLTNRVVTTLPIGEGTQALVYVAGAVPQGQGLTNLTMQSVGLRAVKAKLMAPAKPFPFLKAAFPNAKGTVVTTQLKNLDEMVVSLEGLPVGSRYLVFLTQLPTPPFGAVQYVADMMIGANGKGTVTANGQFFTAFALRGVAQGGKLDAAGTNATRTPLTHVVVWPADPATTAPAFTARGLQPVVTPFSDTGRAGPAILTDGMAPTAPGALAK